MYKKFLTEEESNKIITLYDNGNNIKNVSGITNIHSARISKLLHDKKIQVRRTFPNENFQNIIIEDYKSGLSYINISKKYNIAQDTIHRVLLKNKIDIRSAKFHKVDENYFKICDSHEKAYFLGLLMSDGCVLWNRPKTQISQMIIQLTQPDEYILRHFKDCIKYDGELKFIDNKSNKGHAYKNSYLLSVFNMNFVSEILKFGIIPNKSIIHPFFQNIPDEFINSAILGYFDGDGSVYYYNNSRGLAVSLISSIEFSNKLKEILLNNKIKCSNRIRTTKAGIKMGEIRIKGNNQCLKFYNYIYKSGIKCLTRKKERFEYIKGQQKLGLIKNTSTMYN